ncbi:MAG: hypothetical protein KDA60_18960, partial [Planctomycetales bacterium]|nr:hypothetical protein [Planctomycetales bacterium]
MLRKKLLSVLVLMVVAAGTVFAAEQVEKKINLEHAKCPVSGGKVNADASVDYGKGKLFFCCENCPQAYAKDKDKFTAKANMQLVVTKQVKQTAC